MEDADVAVDASPNKKKGTLISPAKRKNISNHASHFFQKTTSERARSMLKDTNYLEQIVNGPYITNYNFRVHFFLTSSKYIKSTPQP